MNEENKIMITKEMIEDMYENSGRETVYNDGCIANSILMGTDTNDQGIIIYVYSRFLDNNLIDELISDGETDATDIFHKTSSIQKEYEIVDELDYIVEQEAKDYLQKLHEDFCYDNYNYDVDSIQNKIEENNGLNYQLIKACENDETDTLKELLEEGADVHLQNDYLIKVACESGFVDTARLLLENRADIHAQDDYCLNHALINKRTEIVKLLVIEYDMKVKPETLNWLKENNCNETLELIEKRGLNKSLKERLIFNIDDSQPKPSLVKKMKQQGMKI